MFFFGQDAAAKELSQRRVLAAFEGSSSTSQGASGTAAAQGMERSVAEFQACCGVDYVGQRISDIARQGTREMAISFASDVCELGNVQP